MAHDPLQSTALNTEDISHVTNALAAMTIQLDTNQAKIESLLRLVDTVVGYPMQPEPHLQADKPVVDASPNASRDSDLSATSPAPSASLDYLLETKYGIGPRDPNQDQVQVLTSDIARLSELKAQRIEKNKQLLGVVHQYQSAFAQEILPAIRSRQLDRDFDADRDHINVHYDAVNTVYTHYNDYIKETEKLKDAAKTALQKAEDLDTNLLPLYERYVCLHEIKKNTRC